MSRERRGSIIGAVFGLIYLLVNAGPLAPAASLTLRVLSIVAFVAVLFAICRAPDRDEPQRGKGFGREYWLVVVAGSAPGSQRALSPASAWPSPAPDRHRSQW